MYVQGTAEKQYMYFYTEAVSLEKKVFNVYNS